MIPKYHIEYGIEYGGPRDAHVRDFQTDDPVTCESFLVALLEGGLKILTIKHEGMPLTQHESDRLVRNAATTMAAKHVGKSLGLKAEEVHFRFGLAA